MIAFLCLLSSAFAAESRVTLYAPIASAGEVDITRNGNSIDRMGFPYRYFEPHGRPSLAAEVGRPEIGLMLRFEPYGSKNNSYDSKIRGFYTFGPSFHFGDLSAQVEIGSAVNVKDATEGANGDGFVSNVGAHYTFVKAGRLSAAAGIKLHSYTIDYDYGFQLVATDATALISVSAHSR